MAETTGQGPVRQGRAGWKQDPQGVRADILRVAREVFAKNGLSGARVDEIAARTATSKRMIYYYFGDKEGLYRHTLDEAYRSVRLLEDALDLEELPPAAALRRLVEFTFDHHAANPDFIRLVMIENVHEGRFIDQSDAIQDLNRGAIGRLEAVIARGQAEGVFRADADPLAVHWQISALSFFNVSNRHTFSRIFGARLWEPEGQADLRAQAVRAVLGAVLTDAAAEPAREAGGGAGQGSGAPA